MAQGNDRCDFCDRYCHPSIFDRRRDVGEQLWCGECRQGRDAQAVGLDEAEIIKRRDTAYAQDKADPILWGIPLPQRSGAYAEHMRRLELFDRAQLYNEVLQDRGQIQLMALISS